MQTKYQFASASLLLTSGVVMAFCGFFVAPKGEISDSVLWYFSQCLIYAGSVFGVSAYINTKLKGYERNQVHRDSLHGNAQGDDK